MKCRIKNCGNAFVQGKENASYFNFPKDPKLLKQWLEFCEKPKNFKPGTWKVCSDHFKPEDIVGHISCSLGLKRRKAVERDAIPSIFPNDAQDTARDDRIKIRERKKLVSLLLASSEPKEFEEIESVLISEDTDGIQHQYVGEEQEDEEHCDEESNSSNGNTTAEVAFEIHEPCDPEFNVKEKEPYNGEKGYNICTKAGLQIKRQEPCKTEILVVEENACFNCATIKSMEIDLKRELQAMKIENTQLKHKNFELQEALRRKQFEVEVFKKCLIKCKTLDKNVTDS